MMNSETSLQRRYNMILDKGNLLFVFAAVLYRLLLDYVYINAIVPGYSYWSYHDNSTFSLAVISWIIYIILAVPIRKYHKNNGKLSEEIIFILFIFSMAPFTTLVKYGHFDGKYIFLNSVFWVLLYVGHFMFDSNHKKIRLTLGRGRPLLLNEKAIKAFTIFFFASTVFISGYYSGFRILVGITNAEIARLEAITYSMPTLLEYIYLWSQVIVPVFLAYFLKRKNYLYIATCIVTQILSYGINGMKTTLFVTIVVIGLFLIPKMNPKKTNIIVLCLIIFSCILGMLEYKIMGTVFITGIVIMRMMFMPNSISYYYYDFFSNHVPDYFRSSFLSHLGFQSPYSNLPHIIGLNYFHSDMGCNDGLAGDAFANFGIIGIVLLPFLIAYVLKLFDNNSRGLDSRVYLGCAFVIGIRLISSYLVTNLISYGFIILIIILRCLRRDSNMLMEANNDNGKL